jgi:hypothetical protein
MATLLLIFQEIILYTLFYIRWFQMCIQYAMYSKFYKGNGNPLKKTVISWFARRLWNTLSDEH